MIEDTLLNNVAITEKNKKAQDNILRAKEIFSKLFINSKSLDLPLCDNEQSDKDEQDKKNWRRLVLYIVDVINTISALDDNIKSEDNTTDYNEHRLLAVTEITKLANLVDMCNISLSTETFTSLLRRHLQTVNIPYEGKPLDGLQILGILETRNLDFKNVIILSMTDANFPGNHTSQSSLIPYNLRYAYDMPTPEQHEAMYAYYFYRLLQRAKRVDMLYCSRADEVSTGECSRYIYQLDFEYERVEKQSLGIDINIEENSSIVVHKGEKEMEEILKYADENEKPRLSPTRLFKYVKCPLMFYFDSIAKLSHSDELTDKMDALTIGSILHKSIETLYKEHNIVGMLNPQASIKKLRNKEVVEPVVDAVIGEKFYNNPKATTEDFTGDTLLVRDVIIKYIIDGIMYYDSKRDGYIVKELEHSINYRYTTSQGHQVKL
jgi:hypothetical protein